MGLPGVFNYILYDNPISSGTAEYLGRWLSWLLNSNAKAQNPAPKDVLKMASMFELIQGNSRILIRVAGISGAAAVGLGAYGAHSLYPSQTSQVQKNAFETANRYHFLHTIALMGVPMCRRPAITGALMVAGTVIFCGSSYHFAITGDDYIKKMTPYGGVLLIVAWLSLML